MCDAITMHVYEIRKSFCPESPVQDSSMEQYFNSDTNYASCKVPHSGKQHCAIAQNSYFFLFLFTVLIIVYVYKS